MRTRIGIHGLTNAVLRLGQLTAAVLLAVTALAPAAHAATIVVDTLSDELNQDGDCSLREAITAANTNAAVDACPAGSGSSIDTIVFSVSGTIVLGAMLPNIADPAGLTIDGAGSVTISGNNAVAVFTVDRCATLDLTDITVGDTSAVGASAITNHGMLTLTRVTLSNNTNVFGCCGGGVYTTGPVTVTESTFSGNYPNAIYTEANLARGDFATAPVNITNSTFTGNGRSVEILGSPVTIVSTTFAGNEDGFHGGAAITNDRGTVTIERSTFADNRGGRRGAIRTSSGRMTITESTFERNRAYREDTYAVGGAIDSAATALVIADSTFVDNEALFIGLSGFAALGGALAINEGTVTVTNSTFSGNFSRVFNFFGRSNAYGGAIYTAGGSGTVDIVNSTFAGNHTRRYTGSSEPTPEPDSGGTIRRDGMTVTLRNTLVTKSPTDPAWNPVLNCSGSLTDGGGNLSFNLFAPADMTCPGVHADPALDPAGPQDNGGPTRTIALQPGSAAIGAGLAATCAATPVNALDQRGAPRASCDIGAFAYASTPPPLSDPEPPAPLPTQAGCAPVNRVPVVTNPRNQTTAEGVGVSLQIAASDADGDALSYSAAGLPPGLSIDATSGLVTGTPGFTAAGAYGVTVTVTDARGASASVNFTWTVTDVNRPPVLASPGDTTVTAGTPLSFTLSASDLDGDGLTFGATDLPAGASLHPSTGAFSWTPGVSQVGTHTVTFRVTDSGGLEASQKSTITVTAPVVRNRPPDCSTAQPGISEIWPPNHKVLVPVSVVGVTDPDGDRVTITVTRILQDEPTDARGDGATGIDGFGLGTSLASVRAERTGTPAVPGNGRVYEIEFAASDGNGGSCVGSVRIGVPHDRGKGPAIDDGIRYDSTVAGGPRVR